MNNSRFQHLRIKRFVMVCLSFLFCFFAKPKSQDQELRNRGAAFYKCPTSNTSGAGDLWVKFSAIGHIWDNEQIRLDSAVKDESLKEKWASSIRGFPEIGLSYGLFDISMLTIESRPISYGLKPGFISAALKLTWPENKDLRLHGFGAEVKYVYNFINTNPTLGGYIGFMPEGFVNKGNVVESRFIYELDLISRFSYLPLRFISGLGFRTPMTSTWQNYYQYIADLGFVYNGAGFDFFAVYSLEAFNNFSEPKVWHQDNKSFLIYFQENPSYLTVGGNIRYFRALELNVSIPLLLSTNRGSKMTREDLAELNRQNSSLFPDEVKRGIKDPFDPWFVKWKIVCSISFPIIGKLTSAEMMRNYLIAKNQRYKTKIDIDTKLKSLDLDIDSIDSKDDTNRLEKIKKQREELNK